MGSKTYTFNDGSIWENYPWDIVINETCDDFISNAPCKHARNLRSAKKINSYGETYWSGNAWETEVVVAYNEGKYDSTGVCLWCILEAVDKIGLER